MSDSKGAKSKKSLQYLQTLSKQADQPVAQPLISENGFLRPLGEMLNALLENPALRQAMGNISHPGNKKQ